MAALVLTVLTLGPSLDTFVCKDEGGLSAAAAEFTVAVVQDNDHSGAGDERTGLGTCIHGHCHHAAAYVPAESGETSARTTLEARHRVMTEALPTSALRFGLKRPPRA